MSFEVYQPRAKKEGPKPVVRLSKLSLVLNKTAREKLNSPQYVELAFDKNSNMIRIRPSDAANGIAMKKTKIFAKGFFNAFKIEVAGNYFADYNPDDNAIYAKIS